MVSPLAFLRAYSSLTLVLEGVTEDNVRSVLTVLTPPSTGEIAIVFVSPSYCTSAEDVTLITPFSFF
jgi:hypothetical protein